ncbi:hypothetical protein Pmani_008505 [Petrolisthes manimaculis]|uniref:Uncharacterized protein n=1 Tax=Petrolisthes manimaculis TaxID=1843537 RepID=A0AAE1UEL3_9EUCA|nr:hypothetical protein Pmani_008505 [Petrolisthes manimaculis]
MSLQILPNNLSTASNESNTAPTPAPAAPQTPYIPSFTLNVHSRFRHMETRWLSSNFTSEQKLDFVLCTLPNDVFHPIPFALTQQIDYTSFKDVILASP